MATPSVDAVFCTPEIVQRINSCTELLPGVPASTENLQPLWQHISEKKHWSNSEDDVQITLMLQSRGKKNHRLEVHIRGPIEHVAADWGPCYTRRTEIQRKSFEWSIDGLTEALAYAKSTADRVRRKDFCTRCYVDGCRNTDPGDERALPYAQRKRLKARPLPYCAECTLDLATGGPAQKKARR